MKIKYKNTKTKKANTKIQKARLSKKNTKKTINTFIIPIRKGISANISYVKPVCIRIVVCHSHKNHRYSSINIIYEGQ